MWFATTNLEPHQIGPAIAMRLDGVPRQLADALAKKPSDVSTHPLANQLSHVTWDCPDGITWQVKPGCMFLLEALKEHFDKLSMEI